MTARRVEPYGDEHELLYDIAELDRREFTPAAPPASTLGSVRVSGTHRSRRSLPNPSGETQGPYREIPQSLVRVILATLIGALLM